MSQKKPPPEDIEREQGDEEELGISHARAYTAPGVTVYYDRGRCLHFAECVRGLPQVFDVEKRPWIQPENASVEEVAEVVRRCPSGALHYRLVGIRCARSVHPSAAVGLRRTSPSATRRAAAVAGVARNQRLATRIRKELERKEQRTMTTQIETGEREVVLVEDAHIRPMMGLDVLEPLPSRTIPYSQVDPFILVHEGVVPITEERASMDTRHPHRGFDNLWYVLAGEASTGHSTGPGGAMERARLQSGSFLKLRTGRGVWHAEAIGEDELREGKSGTEMRGVLFWVNLARKDKAVEPSAQLLDPQDVPVRQEDEAIVRVLVGDGSPVELGTAGLILDVELGRGGAFSSPVPSEFNGFVYMLEGEADFGVNTPRASHSQIAVLGT